MHFDLHYETRTVVSITRVRLFGKPGVGVNILGVEVDAMTQPAPAAPNAEAVRKGPGGPELNAPRIVTVGGRLLDVGPLSRRNVLWYCVDYAQRQSVQLEAFVSDTQVRALDQSRNGKGALTLQLALEAQVIGRDGIRPADVEIPVDVTMSDWLRVLSEMDFQDRATFEVSLTGPPPLEQAGTFLREAGGCFERRQWADTLTKCRQVLDVMLEVQAVSKPKWSEWHERTQREAWSTDDRLSHLFASVRHLAHAGPHPVHGPVDEGTARVTLTATAALLRCYTERR